MMNFGKCFGYCNSPCPKCNRYRLERFEAGRTVCEKCQWCIELERYVTDEEVFGKEEDWHLEGVSNRAAD